MAIKQIHGPYFAVGFLPLDDFYEHLKEANFFLVGPENTILIHSDSSQVGKSLGEVYPNALKEIQGNPSESYGMSFQSAGKTFIVKAQKLKRMRMIFGGFRRSYRLEAWSLSRPGTLVYHSGRED
jgi:hypothetical protein